MAADTYQTTYFKEPAVYSRNGPHPIVRAALIDTDTLVGDAGSTIASGLLELNDVIKFFKLPPGVRLLYAKLAMEDFDSGTSLTSDVIVTNGTTTKYFFNASTCGRAAAGNTANTVDTRDNAASGNVFLFGSDAAVGYVVPDDNYYVAYKCSAAPAGASTGDEMYLEVGYLPLEDSASDTFN